jgi:endonuclease/exonuclease/phosphatase family metal-dependent hydrolase
MDGEHVTLLTWNVQGSEGLDMAVVVDVVRDACADAVALQEVQRRQARALAEALGLAGRRWAWKHWPVVHRAEGLAVLTPHRLTSARAFALRRAPFWSWRRRIGVDATIERDGTRFGVVDVHLSPHREADRRVHEAQLVLQRVIHRPAPTFICGDLNDLPGQAAYAALLAAGLTDAWPAVHDDGDTGATNWTSGLRIGRPPTQRIDYVLVPRGAQVERCDVLASAERLDEFAALSDHLPLVATVRLGVPQ